MRDFRMTLRKWQYKKRCKACRKITTPETNAMAQVVLCPECGAENEGFEVVIARPKGLFGWEIKGETDA